MLIFGDVIERETVSQKLARIHASVLAAQAEAPGIGRHAHLIAALIEAGELAQGIADECFRNHANVDTPAPDACRAMELTSMLARMCAHSWLHGLHGAPPMRLASIGAWEAQLPAIDIEVKQPEGYAFYALYPECYLETARRLGAGPWRVTGLRSIGTSLAAIVAAVLGDSAPVSLRPVGHPFDRRVEWRVDSRDPGTLRHAVVDEGPGASGSSMAAVIRHLRSAGAAPEKIHLLVSHGKGPGSCATPSVRALWQESSSHAADFDTDILHATQPAHRLRSWVEASVGVLTQPLEDIGSGRWRGAHRMPPVSWPPVHPWQERRKFLARSTGAGWLVKFSGLGHRANQRMGCAEALAVAGFCPEVKGRCHGFLIERWHEAMTPLSADQLTDPVVRELLLKRVADYLAFRARSFPMPHGAGASLRSLCEMARHNIQEALVDVSPDVWWTRRSRNAAELQCRVRPVRTDSRMQTWEWLHCGDRLLKTDAIDHHAGHDLVGCQDVAWDVAGAAIEYDLDDEELGGLIRALASRACIVDEALLDFYALAYPAFQLGHASLAASDTADCDERKRLDDRVQKLGNALRKRLAP